MGKIEDILIDGNQRNASDIHLCPGSPVMFRIDGDLIPMSEEKIKPYEIEEMIKPMLTTEQLEVLEREGELVLHILSQDLTGCVSMCSVKEERMRWHFVSFHLRFRYRRI